MQFLIQRILSSKGISSAGHFNATCLIFVFFLNLISFSVASQESASPHQILLADTTFRQFSLFSEEAVAFIDKIKQDVVFIASHEIVRSVPSETNTYLTERRMMEPEKGHSKEAQIFELYKEFATNNKEASYIYLGTNNGGFIQFPPEQIGNYDPRNGHWYKMGMANPNTVGLTNVYQGFSGEPTISVMQTISDEETLIGVQSLDVSLTSLVESFNAIDLGVKSRLILLDGGGQILSDSAGRQYRFKRASRVRLPFYQKLAKLMPGKSAANFEISGDSNSSIYVFVHYLKELDWYMVSAIDDKQPETHKLK